MIDYSTFKTMLEKNGFVRLKSQSKLIVQENKFQYQDTIIDISYELGGFIKEVKVDSVVNIDVDEIYNKINNN